MGRYRGFLSIKIIFVWRHTVVTPSSCGVVGVEAKLWGSGNFLYDQVKEFSSVWINSFVTLGLAGLLVSFVLQRFSWLGNQIAPKVTKVGGIQKSLEM